MNKITHMGIDYESPNIEIQDSNIATDLDNTKIPTGKTIKSYIDNFINLDYKILDRSAVRVYTETATKIYTCNKAGTYLILATAYFERYSSAYALGYKRARLCLNANTSLTDSLSIACEENMGSSATSATLNLMWIGDLVVNDVISLRIKAGANSGARVYFSGYINIIELHN